MLHIEMAGTSGQPGILLPPDAEILSQGAEARVYKCTYLGRPTIVKERFSKKYRHPRIDKTLIQQRLNAEARSVIKLKKAGVDTPSLYFLDSATGRLFFECVQGQMVKDFLRGGPGDEQVTAVAKKIGHEIAVMHDKDIIHGDLTTSNMMLRQSNGSVVLIDFGLSYTSNAQEDKAVDLYVLERALLSTHPNSEHVVKTIMTTYYTASRAGQSVMSRLVAVRARGRKRAMVG